MKINAVDNNKVKRSKYTRKDLKDLVKRYKQTLSDFNKINTKLSEMHKYIFFLVYVEGYTNTQLSELLGISKSNISRRLKKASKLLRREGVIV